MEECKGCSKIANELELLNNDIEMLQKDYKEKIKEFDNYKGDLGIKLVKIDNKLDHLSNELIDHMNQELEASKKTAIHIENVSKFMTEISTDRKYLILFVAGIIGIIVWFYTQQYLPQMQHMNELLLKIASKGDLE